MNVIVIVADGLRPSETGPYGNEWLPTPCLDHLASQSIVFDQHFIDSPPFTFRARADFPGSEPSPAITWPASVKFIEYQHLLPPWNPAEELLVEQFADWEFEEEPEPWLDPLPGLLAADDRLGFDRLLRTYSAAVRQFDNWLGEIVEQLDDSDLLILTSRRGQYLGEHGIGGDFRPWLFEEFVHLPLMIRLPGSEQRGRRVWHLTQTLDFAPTIFDALGQPIPDDWHGESLLPLCRGGGPIRDYAVMAHSLGDARELALQTTEWKLILPAGDPSRSAMLFVKPDDRWDVNDLRQPNLDYAEQLEQTLSQFVIAARQPGPLQPPPLPQLETTHADGETCR